MDITYIVREGLIKAILLLALSIAFLRAGTLENIKDTYAPLKDEYKHCSPMMGAILWEHPCLLKNLYMYSESGLIGELFHSTQGAFTDTNLRKMAAFHLSPEVIGKIIGLIELFKQHIISKKDLAISDIISQYNTSLYELIKNDGHFQKSINITHAEWENLAQEVEKLEIGKDGVGDRLSQRNINQKRKILNDTDTANTEKQSLTCLVKQILQSCIDELNNKTIPNMTTYILLAFLYKKDFKDGEKYLSDREKYKQYFQALEEYIKKIPGIVDTAVELTKKYKEVAEVEWKKAIEDFKLAQEVLNKVEKEIKLDDFEKKFREARKVYKKENAAYQQKKKSGLTMTNEETELLVIYEQNLTNAKKMLAKKQEDQSYKLAKDAYDKANSKVREFRADFDKANKAYMHAIGQKEASKKIIAQSDVFNAKKTPLTQKEWLTGKEFFYEITDIDAILKQIKDCVAKNQNQTVLVTDLLKTVPYEDIVFTEGLRQWYMGSLPKVAAWKTGVSYRGNLFPDCMDTVIRNLCNIILYDRYNQKFDIKKAPQPDDMLTTFFKKYSTPSNVNDKELNDAWSEVIQNRNCVTYNRLIGKEQPLVFDRNLIRINETMFKSLGNINKEISSLSTLINIITIDNKQYDCVIDQNCMVFELIPSLRSLIILLNTLLGLNLYASEKETFGKNFNSTYFPKLCEKLGWNVECSKNLDDDVDIIIQIKCVGGSFDVDIRYGHGEIIRVSQNIQEDYEIKLFSSIDKKVPTNLPLILLYNNYSKLSYNDFQQDILFPYNCFSIFFVELSDRKKLDIIGTILQSSKPKDIEINLVKNFIKGTPLVEDLNFHIRVLDVLGDKINDFKNELKLIVGRLMKKDTVAFDKIKQFKLLSVFLNKGIWEEQFYVDAIQIAKDGLASSNSNVSMAAIGFFKCLFEKGRGYNEAIAIAKDGVTDDRQYIRYSSLNLFKALFEKNLGYAEAIAVSKDAIINNKLEIRLLALNLFKDLVENGQGYFDAIDAAKKACGSDIIDMKFVALNLFKSLIEKGYGYNEALDMVKENVETKNNMLRLFIYQIFGDLIKQFIMYKKKFAEVAKVFWEIAENNDIKKYIADSKLDNSIAELKKYQKSDK